MRRSTRISNQPGVDYNDDCKKETFSTSILTVVMAEVAKNIDYLMIKKNQPYKY